MDMYPYIGPTEQAALLGGQYALDRLLAWSHDHPDASAAELLAQVAEKRDRLTLVLAESIPLREWIQEHYPSD